MFLRSLELLSCPAPGCSQELAVGDAVEPGWGAEGDLLEGVLACTGCGAEYPVLLGVALLVPEQHHYLWAFWSDIELCAAALPVHPISRAMRIYLAAPGARVGQAEPAEEREESLDWTTSPYLQWRWDAESLPDGLPEGWWRDSLARFGGEELDPYGYLESLAEGGDGLAVEAGCGVGAMTSALAGRYRSTIGIDWSFRAILTARRYLLGSPEPLAEYPLEEERGEIQVHPLPAPATAPGLELIVADAGALPFPEGAAACVAALNLLCAVPDPLQAVSELTRIAAPGGLLLHSSPYWTDDEAPPIGSPDAIKAALAPAFDVVAERDMVPWLLRVAKRRWNLHLCHCLAARRR